MRLKRFHVAGTTPLSAGIGTLSGSREISGGYGFRQINLKNKSCKRVTMGEEIPPSHAQMCARIIVYVSLVDKQSTRLAK